MFDHMATISQRRDKPKQQAEDDDEDEDFDAMYGKMFMADDDS